MATNRYTRLSPTEFTPLSLEEMMMVPLAKQKRQDDLLNQQDLALQELSNIKRLSNDDEDATQIIEGYRGQMEEISNKIGNEGINNQTISNFRNLYNNYKTSISESGELGKIQNNYTSAKEKEKAYRASMLQRGHSINHIQDQVDKQYGNFDKTIGEEGEYNEFGDFRGSGFYDHMKEIDTPGRYSKTHSITVGGEESDLTYDPNTQMYVKTKKGTTTNESNIKQLQAALNSVLQDYSTGDKRAYLEAYGISQDQFREIVEQRMGVHTMSKRSSTADSKTYMNAPAKKKGNGSGDDGPKGNIYATYDKSEAIFRGQSIDEINRNISELSVSDPLQARRVQTYYKDAVANYNNSDAGKALRAHKDEARRNVNNSLGERKVLIDKLLEEYNGKANEGAFGETYENNFTIDDIIAASNPENSGIWNGIKFGQGFADYSLVMDSDYVSILKKGKVNKGGNGIIKGRENPVIAFKLPKEDFMAISDLSNEDNEVNRKLREANEVYNNAVTDHVQAMTLNSNAFIVVPDKSSEYSNFQDVTKRALASAGTNAFKFTDGLVIDNNDGTSRTLMGDELGENQVEEYNKFLFNAIKNPTTKVEPTMLISDNPNGLPSFRVRITPTPTKDSATNLDVRKSYEVSFSLDQLNINGTEVGGIQNMVLDQYAKMGGDKAQNVVDRIRKKVKYKDVTPTFKNDYSISKNIKGHMNDAIKPSVDHLDLDISMVRGEDQFGNSIKNYHILAKGGDKDNNESSAIGWGDFLHLADKPDTKGIFEKLTPSLGRKLLQDIKRFSPGVGSIQEMGEEGVDEALRTLSKHNMSITSEDYIELLEIFK